MWKGCVTYSLNIIAGISISILATAITGIIVSTTTGSPKTGSMENTTIDYGTKVDDRDNPLTQIFLTNPGFPALASGRTELLTLNIKAFT